jgi:hypothetical protein
MRASRGMGAINKAKMPKAQTVKRKDISDDATCYAKGGSPKGLWANIHAKRKRIAAGSGEKMRPPGAEGAPTAKALRKSKNSQD